MTAHLIAVKKRKDELKHYENLMFPESVQEIHVYGYNIFTSKKRRYLIELHVYQGFAFLKFYPKHLKNNKRKYEIRGKELGFHLTKEQIITLLYECAKIMRDYLEKNHECFVGYIGQPDHKDFKLTSKRSNIYNLLTNSIFIYPRYKLSSKKIFQEVNLRLIRKVISEQEGKITHAQMQNYQNFLEFFKENKDYHVELMTRIAKEKYISDE